MDRQFGTERAKVSKRIMQLTERHEQELAKKMQELRLGHGVPMMQAATQAADGAAGAGQLAGVAGEGGRAPSGPNSA